MTHPEFSKDGTGDRCALRRAGLESRTETHRTCQAPNECRPLKPFHNHLHPRADLHDIL